MQTQTGAFGGNPTKDPAGMATTQVEEEPELEVKMKPASPFMQCFWDLATIDESTRLDAVVRLVRHLVDAQESFERIGTIAGAAPPSDAAPGDALGLCNEVWYAVKR